MAPDTIVPSEIKPGTVTFDICHLLSEGRVLISNDRKYVCVEADPNNAKVAITSENKNMYVQPVWSMEDDEGPMSLELVIVKEVVLERRTTMVRGDAVIRSVLFVGRSSSKDPKKIDVLERARRESDVLDYVLSKPEIKKNGYFKQCQFFFLFLIGTLFCLSRPACLLTRKNLAPGSERKTMGKRRFEIFLLSLLLIHSVHE